MINIKEKENVALFFIMVITVPLAGELNFHPFNGDFRVSFGTPVFFLFLLWIRNIHPILSGLFTGISVVIFRILLDSFILTDNDLEISMNHHFPVFFYYVTYASVFYFTKVRRFYEQPIWIGLLGTLMEVLASINEIFFRSLLVDHPFSFTMVNELVLIAIIRSFFVLGFFSIFMLRETKMAAEQQRKRNDEMLLLIANLYEESIQLKKSCHHAEAITRDCYNLYRQLKEKSTPLSQSALRIAGQVHEIKKDNQRILAGLSRLISHKKSNDRMSVEELGQLIIRSNEKYALLLKKDIEFYLEISGKHPEYHTYTTLSLINNLISNSIEAIEQHGEITLSFVVEKGEYVHFIISDNGPGIPAKHQNLIYNLGYTTKYDISGQPSTGIGLSYVKDLVTSLNGELTMETNDNGTAFSIKIPIKQIS